jgi:hypothetical protein
MVFEHRFIARIDEGDDAGLVEAGNGEAEVEVLVVHALAADAVEVGGVLGVGVGLGIEVLDAELALGKRGVFLEQVVHAAHVELDLLRHVVGVAGGVVADDHRGIELAEDGAGAVGERVDLFLGEVGAAVAERGERDEPVGEHGDGDECGDSEGRAGDGMGDFHR